MSSAAQPIAPYAIGVPGTPWGADERRAWLQAQRTRRSYADEVLAPLAASLPAQAELFQYGTVDYASSGFRSYSLVAVRSRGRRLDRPLLLITGGVHGYETSGVQGALQFIVQEFGRASEAVDLLVLPCISPWSYETINRWNPEALDPNRHFKPAGTVTESTLAMACVADHGGRVDAHVDLHETTDTDNSEFGPAKAARDGTAPDLHTIPDGFYLVADSERPAPDFQRALIDAVRRVTHIAEPDAQGRIIGAALQQEGVIALAKRASGLCGGMTHARFVTTTEVYPDSPAASPDRCNAAQLAALLAAIDHLRHA